MIVDVRIGIDNDKTRKQEDRIETISNFCIFCIFIDMWNYKEERFFFFFKKNYFDNQWPSINV